MSTAAVALLLYLFTRADMLISAATSMFWVTLIASSIAATIAFIVGMENRSHYPFHDSDVRCSREALSKYSLALCRKILARSPLIYLPLLFLMVVLPTQKDLALIVGGAVGYEAVQVIAKDERVRDTGSKAWQALGAWLDSQQEANEE